jgi:multicomponent Na+:H+ antiporter subunit E
LTGYFGAPHAGPMTHRLRDAAASYGLLAATWLVLSGHYDPLLLSFGALSCAFVVALVLRMDIVDQESHPYHLGLRPLVYIPWLLWQVVLSNLDVAKRILDPNLPIEPTVVRVMASQKSTLGQVFYANSITLTPGTVSLEVKHGTILVHCLSRGGAQDLKAGEMDRRVTKLEGL